MNEIDGFLVLLNFPNWRQTETENECNFTIFSLSQGVASLRPIHSHKTACSTSRICIMCFAREENAITRRWQNQKHRLPLVETCKPHLEEWPCLQRINKNRLNKALQERKQKYKASKKERNNQSDVSPWEKNKAKTVWRTDMCQTWRTEGDL